MASLSQIEDQSPQIQEQDPESEMQATKSEQSESLNHSRKSKIDLLLIALIGLLLQAFWVSQLTDPTYMDAFYYTTNGQRLAAGHGFTEMVVWQFLDDPEGLPTPSHTYWMPLPSIMAGIGYRLRNDFTGAQSLFWLLGGLLPLLSYTISWQLSKQRWQAWAAALLAAAGGYYSAFLAQPSTFAPFAWAGGLCLFALGLVSTTGQLSNEGESGKMMSAKRRRLLWFAAGLTAGLAHLTRADGLLLLFVGLFIWVLIDLRPRFRTKKRQDNQPIPPLSKNLSHLILILGGYLLVVGWWMVRNWRVSGRPLSVAGAQSIFLTTYDDLFAYGRVNDAASFLAWGWQNILLSRVQGLWFAVQSYVAIPGLIFLVPFILFALWHFYRQPSVRLLLRPAVIYAVALVISAALIFTFPGIRGSLFHSSIALWPWTTALAAAGIGLAVDWAASRLPHWQPERAKRIFSALFILVAFVLSFFVSQFRLTPTEEPVIYDLIGDMIPSSSIVMVGNAPALHYYTDLPAISVPNEPIEVVLQAADRYGVTHLVLDVNRPLPLDDLYQGQESHDRLNLLHTFDDVILYELVDLQE